MLPGLGQEALPQPEVSPMDPWFDRLLEWIDAHCHLPLSLSELEARSSYSRRLLQ